MWLEYIKYNELLGFPLTSSPIKIKSKSDKKYKSAPSRPVPSHKNLQKSSKSAKSTPVSLVLTEPTLSVLGKISNTETEINSVKKFALERALK